MITEASNEGQQSAALLAYSTSGTEYLDEISLGLLTTLSDADLLTEVRALEEQMRSIQVAWHGLIAQLEHRGLPRQLAATGTSTFLQNLLHLSPHEAKQRVEAAQVLGPRVSVDGQHLEPLLPVVAAAQAAGQVSAEQARVIERVLDRVPGTVAAADLHEAERHLVDAARHLRPREIGQLGERILAHLDPDGVLGSEKEHERRRTFTLAPMSDGSYRAGGYLTPACGAQLLATLDAHAAPVPSLDGVADPRSPGQRMHDSLADLAGLCLRHNELHDAANAPQLVITMTAEQFTDHDALAETSFGQLISVGTALRLADEAQLAFLVRDARGAVLAEGRSKRLATRAQTLALTARDKGCSFPGCDRPPEWCQRTT